MIKLENISVSFEHKKVLKELVAHAKQGDFVTIVGANGAGKTTLQDVIAGRRVPDSGRVIIGDVEVTGDNEQSRSHLIGRLMQDTCASCVPDMTVRENLVLAWCKSKSVSCKRALRLLEDPKLIKMLNEFHFDITTFLDRPMKQLSGGQRQIVSFIMAALVPPKILLLDEPTAALDPQAATQLLSFIADFARTHEITTILITHDPNIARIMGNKLWVLHDGTINEFIGEDKQSLAHEQMVGSINYDLLRG